MKSTITAMKDAPLRRVLLVIAFLFSGIGTAYADAPVNTLDKALFGFKPSGIAVRGFDTVAYFTQGEPVEGSSEITADWMGATWQFSSAENRDLFVASPARYAPQYGGYCAYGVAQGYLVKIEPTQWKIHSDKLYLNFDKSVNKKWLKDIPGFVAKSDENIMELLAKD